jgi:hypothetical protein
MDRKGVEQVAGSGIRDVIAGEIFREQQTASACADPRQPFRKRNSGVIAPPQAMGNLPAQRDACCDKMPFGGRRARGFWPNQLCVSTKTRTNFKHKPNSAHEPKIIRPFFGRPGIPQPRRFQSANFRGGLHPLCRQPAGVLYYPAALAAVADAVSAAFKVSVTQL